MAQYDEKPKARPLEDGWLSKFVIALIGLAAAAIGGTYVYNNVIVNNNSEDAIRTQVALELTQTAIATFQTAQPTRISEPTQTTVVPTQMPPTITASPIVLTHTPTRIVPTITVAAPIREITINGDLNPLSAEPQYTCQLTGNHVIRYVSGAYTPDGTNYRTVVFAYINRDVAWSSNYNDYNAQPAASEDNRSVEVGKWGWSVDGTTALGWSASQAALESAESANVFHCNAGDYVRIVPVDNPTYYYDNTGSVVVSIQYVG